MNLFSRVKCALIRNSWDQMLREYLAGNDVTPTGDIDATGEAAYKFTAVFGCLRVLAETFASVPIHEYKKIDDDDRERTDETGLLDILHTAPNSEMSAYNFKEMGMYQINTGGNLVCVRLKTPTLGGLVGLQPLNWNFVTIERNEDTQKIQYVYKPQGQPQSENKTYFRDEVFHVPGPSVNGINGMSPLEYASQAIKLGITYEKFGVQFFKNGANASGIFKHPGFLKDEAYKRLKENLTEHWTGLQNAGKPILAEDGLDFVPFQLKLADAELLASKKFQVEDICRVYRVPLHLVQNLDKATFSNIEQQSLEFVMYTMLPWFKRWEECINCQLLSRKQREDGYYFEFNMSALLRGDSKSMAEAFAQGRQWGWLSVNDIRRLLNLNKIPNGDIYLQPMNMYEAGKEPPKSPPPEKKIVAEIENLINQRS
jgi:HK97 family phage portal protein